MDLFKTMNISASALTAQSFRMDVIAQNIANANTTRTADGGPYQRRATIISEQQPSFEQAMREARDGGSSATGIRVMGTVTDETPGAMVYDPQHPDANEEGYVAMPNVDIAREYVDMISATRSYEANITVMNATKRMAQKALDISRG